MSWQSKVSTMAWQPFSKLRIPCMIAQTANSHVSLKCCSDFLDFEGFDHVTDLYIVIVFQTNAAFIS